MTLRVIDAVILMLAFMLKTPFPILFIITPVSGITDSCEVSG